MSAIYYLYGQKGRASKAHIARYKPSGYGVAALCGKSWREGDFAFSYSEPMDVCTTCRRRADSPEDKT